MLIHSVKLNPVPGKEKEGFLLVEGEFSFIH